MVRLLALGGLTLVDDDGPMPGSAARGRNLALLTLLSRSGEAGITRDRIAALLWPESPEARARHSLDQALYTIRRALGGEPVRTAGATLALNRRALPSDIADFQEALGRGTPEAAVDLYGGPFLDGFHLSGAPEFEAWAATERAVLHAAWVRALESLAVEAGTAGDHPGSVAWWRSLAAAEPLSSRVARSLMEALERAGDRAGALEAARVHGALVEAELGAPPDPALIAYEAELRAEPGAPRRPAPKVTAARPDRTRAPEVEPAVDGRDEDPVTAAAAPGRAASAERGARGPSPRPWVRVAAPVAAGVAALGWAGALVLRSSPGPPSAPPSPDAPFVLVEPFEDETGDPRFASLGAMAGDWITEGLLRTGLVRVLGPEGVAGGAAAVVSGRVYHAADSVWVQARVADATDGRILRSTEPVGAPAADPARTLEPLRQRVLGALGTLFDPRLTAWAETALRPPAYGAFQQLAAGLDLFAEPRDLEGAAQRFRRAAELDPEYALPRLWLAWVGMLDGRLDRTDSVAASLEPSREAMSPVERAWLDRIQALLAGDNERSYRAARRMVELAPRSGWVISLASAALDTNRPGVASAALRTVRMERLGLEAGWGWFLLTTALHLEGDYPGELEAAEEGIRTVGAGWGYAGPGVPALAALGRTEDLARRLDELRGLPPLDDGVPRGLATLEGAATELRAHGYVAEAEALVERLLPAERDADAEPARRVRTELLYEMGRWEDVAARLGTLAADEAADVPYRALVALVAARRGDVASARAVDGELGLRERPWELGEKTFWRARIHAVLGDEETALDLLRRSFAEGRGARDWHEVHVSRDFDSLRGSPDFQALVKPGGWPGPGAAP